MPARVWRSIMPDNAKGATGYTHAWRSPKARGYSEFLMASVESRAEAEEARARGWRSFLLVPLNRAIPDGFLWCPGDALNPATKLPCSRCGACTGTRGRSKADVAMYVHGTAAATFAPGRQRLSTVGLERRPHLAYDPLVRMEKDLHAELKAHCAARGVRMKRWLDAVVRERLAAESDDV